MARTRKKIALDAYEQRIEESLGDYDPVSAAQKTRLLDSIAKTRTITLRINERVLEHLKRKAREEGLPYQTLITSVLFKFCTDRLVDEHAIRKVVAALR
jgi:predicted DNA binding CopG/RHH family protein